MLHAAACEVIKEMSKTTHTQKMNESISLCNMQICQSQSDTAHSIRHKKYFILLFLAFDSRPQNPSTPSISQT